MIDAKVIQDHGLTREEYDRIVELIGRHPNLTELGIFSLMWSEHCSYKSSRVHLKKLPVTGENTRRICRKTGNTGTSHARCQ